MRGAPVCVCLSVFGTLGCVFITISDVERFTLMMLDKIINKHVNTHTTQPVTAHTHTQTLVELGFHIFFSPFQYTQLNRNHRVLNLLMSK